jgi:hypothetical protein
MRGELWRLAEIGGGYQLWYNKDVPPIAAGIKLKLPNILGLILPAAIREILARELLWGEFGTPEPTEWIQFAQAVYGEPPPERGADGETPSEHDREQWIDGVIAAFCETRARFFHRILETEDTTP